ncbi:hypothetical protein [Streptomyces lunaelactis]
MGMRNVTAMRAKVPDMTTTVATRTITALVSGSTRPSWTRYGRRSG